MQRLGDEFLGHVRSVRVGRVDEIHSELDGAAKHADGFFLVRRLSEDARAGDAHGAKAHAIDDEIAAERDAPRERVVLLERQDQDREHEDPDEDRRDADERGHPAALAGHGLERVGELGRVRREERRDDALGRGDRAVGEADVGEASCWPPATAAVAALLAACLKTSQPVRTHMRSLSRNVQPSTPSAAELLLT